MLLHPLNINYKNNKTMKKIMMAMSAALMLTACSEHETDGELIAMVTQQDAGKSKTITFTFGPEMRQMTRASLAELSITDLWLFDYMGNELMRQLLTALRSGSPLTVQYLPDDSDRMAEGRFWVEQMAQPVYAFSRSGVPYWHNVEFTLREVEPHD